MSFLNNIESVYLIGIGGIGMSALARFFNFDGKSVGGYDRMPTQLTNELESEGIGIHFDDDIELIDGCYKQKEKCLVIYTPAIPNDHSELNFFLKEQFTVLKRAEVLGLLTQDREGICIAGTHGKTTVSTMTAHLLKHSAVDCSAFLGGISLNYNTNLLVTGSCRKVVLEADEFDRSFLHLNPQMAVITAVDADHLDIYGEVRHVEEAFEQFVAQIKPQGVLVIKKGLAITPVLQEGSTLYTYDLNDPSCDFFASNIKLDDISYVFDLNTPQGIFKRLKLGIPGLINVENAVAASAMAVLSGVSHFELQSGLATFKGIRRRFEYRLKEENIVFVDDYAHHPEEIRAMVKSVRDLYPEKEVLGIFQPHLFSRTKDFADEFACSLDLLDRVILLDIYPARELPIEGVTSAIIKQRIMNTPVDICSKEELSCKIIEYRPQVLLTMGAGDIDKEVPKIEKAIREKFIGNG